MKQVLFSILFNLRPKDIKKLEMLLSRKIERYRYIVNRIALVDF